MVALRKIGLKDGGEGGIRTLVGGFPDPRNGLAKRAVSGPVVWIQQVASDGEPLFGPKYPRLEATVPQLFFPFANMPTLPRHDVYTQSYHDCAIRTILWRARLAKTRLSKNRLLSIVASRAVLRAKELYQFGAHPEDLTKAVDEGLLVRIGRGLYTLLKKAGKRARAVAEERSKHDYKVRSR